MHTANLGTTSSKNFFIPGLVTTSSFFPSTIVIVFCVSFEYRQPHIGLNDGIPGYAEESSMVWINTDMESTNGNFICFNKSAALLLSQLAIAISIVTTWRIGLWMSLQVLLCVRWCVLWKCFAFFWLTSHQNKKQELKHIQGSRNIFSKSDNRTTAICILSKSIQHYPCNTCLLFRSWLYRSADPITSNSKSGCRKGIAGHK